MPRPPPPQSDPTAAADPETERRLEGRHHARQSLRSFWRRPENRVAAGIFALGLIMVVIPVAWLPHDPTKIDMINRLKPPSWSLDPRSFPLGTDVLGRDIFSRIIYGARWTFLVCLSAASISTVVGTLAGLAAGYYGATVDAVISRLMDMQLAFPVILLALSVLAVAGPSLINLILVLGLVDWARYARVVRAATLSQRQHDYVEAARALGANPTRIALAHILPNILSSLVVMTTFSTALLLLTESALSFLGLGVAPPAVTWGSMIGSGRDYIYQAWWIATMPGIVITIMVLAINFLGDGLRDAFDPRER
ncbi:MAG: ABC transporter permease [Truepera sp.]|nr:ABC transporter permease [Truepera sp.]